MSETPPGSVSLRDYIERIFNEREATTKAHLSSAEKALDAAAGALNARLEAMNQFRAQINEERLLYVRKDAHEIVENRISRLEDTVASLRGRFLTVGIAITVATGIFSALLVLVLRHLG